MEKRAPAIFSWENWPFGVLYFPLSFVWLYYIIRSRAVWFFTPSNPAIAFGGLQGETKSEMYARLPACLYPATFVVQPTASLEELLHKLHEQEIRLPFIVKPEVGEGGILFRKITLLSQLKEYHQKVKDAYLVQSLVPYPMEVSIFYCRMPNETSGVITGFLHKVPLHVTGDGVHTVLQLIKKHPKATAFFAEFEKAHAPFFDQVPGKDEKYVLSNAGNHRRGARFYNLQSEVDEKLLQVANQWSHTADGWYYGRFDIMCRSIEDLKNGEHYSILEYNGCGAEPNHIYDNGYTLWQAYKEIVRHWEMLYRISSYNARKGIQPWPFLKGWLFLQEGKRKLKKAKETEKALSF